MNQVFEDSSKFSRKFLEAGMKSFASLSGNMQEIAVATGESTKRMLESGSVALEKLASATSPEKAFEIQSDYARQTYENLVTEGARLGELYADAARDACLPFESVTSKTK